MFMTRIGANGLAADPHLFPDHKLGYSTHTTRYPISIYQRFDRSTKKKKHSMIYL